MPPFEQIQKRSTILITCPKGISDFLKDEITAQGFKLTGHFPTGVSITGSLLDCQLLNLTLATAHHVLLLIKEFNCKTPDDLYREVLKVDWENIVPATGYVCVTSIVHTRSITDTRFANLKCKDAIVDRLAQKNGKRCDSGSERDHTVVHVYWNEDRCMLYIDTSGQPLSKRGYRLNPGIAPMQETLAAAVVRATGFDGTKHFINPMCGSATLAIEAAYIAHNKAPGLGRPNFGFMHLKSFDLDEYAKLRRDIMSRERKASTGSLIATDFDPAAMASAQTNVKNAGFESSIELGVCDFDRTQVPLGGGVVVINPEYGMRMGEPEKLKLIYKQIGTFFKRQCGGYTGFVFTGNFELAKFVGLKAKWKSNFLSGKIDCRLYAYELYAGQRTL